MANITLHTNERKTRTNVAAL